MVSLLIWSKDRACQLEALLRSIYTRVDGLFSQITVIYKASTSDFAIGYKIVREKFKEVNFVYEQSFFEDTIVNIANARSEYIAFSTDDTVIFRDWPETVFMTDFLPQSPSSTSSLRLGFNTTIQDCHRCINQPALNIFNRRGDIIEWDCRFYHPLHNYGYPLSLDMHIFHKSKMMELVTKFSWSNTNQLESGLQNFRNDVRYIQSLNHSIAVNIPINNMSGVTQAGQTHNYTNEFLNEKFLNGSIISLESISKNDIRGCHQEVAIEFNDNACSNVASL